MLNVYMLTTGYDCTRSSARMVAMQRRGKGELPYGLLCQGWRYVEQRVATEEGPTKGTSLIEFPVGFSY